MTKNNSTSITSRGKNHYNLSSLIGLSLCVNTVFAGHGDSTGDLGLGLSDLSLYDLSKVTVTSNSFYDQSLENTPGSITVIGSNRLSNSSTQNLAELLEFYVPGVHVGASEQYGPAIGFRGVQKSSNTESLVMFNGQSLNQNLFFGYTAGYLLPLLGDVHQIEIIKGPGSLVHGSGADAGFINLLPKNGTDNPGFFTGAEYGFVDNLKKIEFGYGKKFGRQHDLFVYGGTFQANGYNFDNDFGASSNPDFQNFANLLRDKNVGGLPRPGYKLTANYRLNNFSFTGLFQTIDIHPDTFVPTYDEDASWHQTILAINPKYLWKFTKHEALELSTSMELIDFGIENRRTLPEQGNIPAADSGGAEGNYEFKWILSSNRFKNHRLALGFSASHRELIDDDQFFADAPASAFFAALDTEWQEYAVFFEDIFDIRKDLNLSFGLRYDYINYSPIGSSVFRAAGFGDAFTVPNRDNLSYRAALAYKLSPYSNIKLSLQSGFHYPDAAQYVRNVTFSSELAVLGENRLASLKPEKIESLELSYSHLFPKQKLSTSINLYYNHHSDSLLFFNFRNATNRFSQTAINTIVTKYFFFGAFENSTQDHGSLGFETSISWKPTNRLSADFSYSFSTPINVDELQPGFTQISYISEDSDEWLAYPAHQLRAAVDYNWSDWRLNLSSIFESKVDIETPQAVFNSGIEEHYFRLNGKLEYQLSKRSSIYLLGKNILGNDTPPVSFINYLPFNGNLGVDERLVYLGFRYKF